MDDLRLNYQELSFISDLSQPYCKDLFCKLLGVDKVKKNEEINVSVLKEGFSTVSSLDDRYDGLNKLHFYLAMKKDAYKNNLNCKSSIKLIRFSGGKSIFYKILSDYEIEHANHVLSVKHEYLYGTVSMNKVLSKY